MSDSARDAPTPRRAVTHTFRCGKPAKARPAYLEFLNFWKDADPDIPILKQAKAEYAKLK